MARRKNFRHLGLLVFWLSMGQGLAKAQPWDLFIDSQSSSQCDLVNADNAQLVVLTDTGQLVIVTQADVTLVDTFVDLDGNVFFEGQQAGFIDFADDGDDFRTLWWTGLTGQVVVLDPFTSVPAAGNFFPEDFFDVPCDACPFWDDPSACSIIVDCIVNADCADGDVCTNDACIAGVCVHISNLASCDDGLFCTLVDSCLDGVCVGFGDSCPFLECDEFENVCFDPGLPPVVVNLCGSNMALTMSLTAIGLLSMRLVRRRSA